MNQKLINIQFSVGEIEELLEALGVLEGRGFLNFNPAVLEEATDKLVDALHSTNVDDDKPILDALPEESI